MKKRNIIIVVFISILCFTLVGVSIKNNLVKSNDDLYVCIDSLWHNNIIANLGEPLYLETQMYANKDLSSMDIATKLILDNNIETMNNFVYSSKDELSNIYIYKLEYSFALSDGLLNINNLSNGLLSLTLNSKVYNNIDLGNTIISVLTNNSINISVEGGTHMIVRNESVEDKLSDVIFYQARYDLRNLSEHPILVKDILLNDDESIKSSIVSEEMIQPGEHKNIFVNISIDNNIRNSKLQPKVVFEIDDKIEEFVLSPFYILSEEENLYEFVKANNIS